MNYSVLFIYADGFEDTEAVASRDVLVRAGFQVYDYSINRNKEVIASHNMKFIAPHCLDEGYPMCDVVVIPGGSRGVNNLLASSIVESLLKDYQRNGKLICAICAGPMVLAKAGVINGERFTCYPGCESGINGVYTGNEVEVTEKIITARSMLYSVPFGLAIIEKMLGKEKKDFIYKQIAGEL